MLANVAIGVLFALNVFVGAYAIDGCTVIMAINSPNLSERTHLFLHLKNRSKWTLFLVKSYPLNLIDSYDIELIHQTRRACIQRQDTLMLPRFPIVTGLSGTIGVSL